VNEERYQIDDRVAVILHKDGVAEVRLDRADKMNALDSAMFSAILKAGEQLMSRPSLRAVVLSGEGRAFCAGLDMGSFQKMGAGQGGSTSAPGAASLADRTYGIANAAQHTALVWRELPVPVIAALHGVAFGGGLQIALGADVRLIARDTKLSVMELKWGLVPDMGGMVTLAGLVRDDLARELVYSGRVMLAEEAVQLGLATRIVADPLAEAMAMARDITGKSPDAIRAAKRLLNLARTADIASVLMAESIEQQRLIGSPNQVEAVRANLERRTPTFSDPEDAGS
jgi:enoyl-CoA hydratase/carnithine racemase